MADRRRIPGEKNPTPDDREVQGISNAALSRAGGAGPTGAGMPALLGALQRWKAHRAKKRAMAAAEERRNGEGSG